MLFLNEHKVILFPSPLYPPWVHVYLQVTIPNFVFIRRVPTLSFTGWNPKMFSLHLLSTVKDTPNPPIPVFCLSVAMYKF